MKSIYIIFLFFLVGNSLSPFVFSLDRIILINVLFFIALLLFAEKNNVKEWKMDWKKESNYTKSTISNKKCRVCAYFIKCSISTKRGVCSLSNMGVGYHNICYQYKEGDTKTWGKYKESNTKNNKNT